MKRLMKKFQKLLFFVIIISLIMVSLSVDAVSSEEIPDVVFSFIPNPTIDVVLAKQRSGTNVANFKQDLLQALAAQKIDTNLVEVTAVKAENVDIATNFNWNRDISSSIGNISISQNGKDVTMVGNYSNPGKNAIWIIPEENQEQEFNFSYNIDYGDSFNAAGMLLRVEKDGNTLRGYMLSFNNTSGDNWYGSAGSNYGGIWEFSYTLGQNSTNMSKTLKKGINISKSGTLNVKVDDNQITINGGGLGSTVTYVLQKTFGNGYGFFSDHYSHGCEQYGRFALTGINLTATTVRKFSEILREPKWRANTIKVLVNVSDVINEELDSDIGQGELVSRLLNENINYVAWGKNVNQRQHDNLIVSNNDNGKFINNTEYGNSIAETAKYIKTLLTDLGERDNYLLVDEPVAISSQPDEILKNTIDTNYPYGKWKIEHDYRYYQNTMGQLEQANKYISDMVNGFNKTGKYIITYADKTIAPHEIYVHRRPTAIIRMERNGDNVNFVSNSYDLDQFSEPNRGITQELWKYKKTTDTTWTDGKITTLEPNTSYLVQLRVKDEQNTWSYTDSLYLTTKPENNKPIAYFNIKNGQITKYETLEVTDRSYDPLGQGITERKWEVYKDEIKINEGDEPLITYPEIGTYVMKLTVTNSKNVISETYSRTFKIVNDTTPPEVTVDPDRCEWTQNMNVNVSFSDVGGSEFNSYQYAITDDQEVPKTWSNEITKQQDSIIIQKEGRKYLHIKAKDNAGNVNMDRVFSEYLIDNSKPIINVEVDTINKKIDTLIANITAKDNYSGVKNLTIEGIPIEDNTVGLTKNGMYEIYAEDNVGHYETRILTVTNIYYQCKAGLKHPDYSSDYDRCPICEMLHVDEETGKSTIEIKKSSNVYDGKSHRVEYILPEELEIVEYYNDTIKPPTDVGKYSYELKLLYQGNEYETGIKGTYEVVPREITCERIQTMERQYDKTKDVEIIDGQLVNIIEGDDVQAVIPKMGKAESEQVGTWKVSIEDIVLIGEDAVNYRIIQPEYGTITSTIIEREITCEGILGKTKKYDRSNLVEIIGGKLVNTIEGDDIKAIIPKIGTAESEKIGVWKTTIEDITLEGVDIKNYHLTQPEKIMTVITRPDEPLMQVNAMITNINKEQTGENIKKQAVRYGDIVKIKISVQNQGKGSGYVSNIKTKLPEGVELLENSQINEKYHWEIQKDNIIQTDIYSIENDINNELFIKKENNDNEEKEEKVVELEMIIRDSNRKEKELSVPFIIKQQDKNGDTIDYNEENKENNNDEVTLDLDYFDVSIQGNIKQIIITNSEKAEEINIQKPNNQIVRLDIPGRKLEQTQIKVTYEILLNNEGTTEGIVNKLEDILPQGTTFLQSDNPSWKQENGKVFYQNEIKIKEKEARILNFVLRWNLQNNNIGARENTITLDANREIDQMLIEEGKLKLENTNNIAHSKIVSSIHTGLSNKTTILTILFFISILIIGINMIKKYVMGIK